MHHSSLANVHDINPIFYLPISHGPDTLTLICSSRTRLDLGLGPIGSRISSGVAEEH